MFGEEVSAEGRIHIYISERLALMAKFSSHGKVWLSWQSSARVHH